jgi:hypothetical protein
MLVFFELCLSYPMIPLIPYISKNKQEKPAAEPRPAHAAINP